MGTSYSYPASHLRGGIQDHLLGESSTQAIAARHLTEDAEQMLKTAEELALISENRRQFVEAAELRARALFICQEELGPDNPRTLRALGNLSIVYEHQGEYQKAGKLYDQVPTELSIAQSHKAVQHWEQVLAVRKELLGSEHPATLSMIRQLSRGYKTIGKRNEAAQIDKSVYDSTRRVLGEAAPATLESAEQLAESHTYIGQLHEAAALEEIIVKMRKRSLGMKDSNTQRAMENLGMTYDNIGRQQEAAQLQEWVVDSRLDSLGSQHPKTLQAQYRLARYYRTLGKDGEAKALEGNVKKFLEAAIRNLDLGPNSSVDSTYAEPFPTVSTSKNTLEMQSGPAKRLIKVFSPTRQWCTFSATIDTNTENNMISAEVVDTLQLPVHPLGESQYSASSGATLRRQNSVIEILWCGYNSQQTRQTEVRVVENAQFDLLFGSDFLFSEALLNIREQKGTAICEE